jgi:hypothetical protein
MSPSWIALVIVAAGAVALVIARLVGALPTAIGTGGLAGIVALLALAAWIGPGVLRDYQGRGGTALRHVAIWLAIVVAAVLLYRFIG